MIFARGGLKDDQVQIASVDCTLGGVAYKMKSAALPHGECVDDLIQQYSRFDFRLTREKTSCLERGVCYIIPLQERLRLGRNMRAVFSPKSSTGRNDVFVRVLSDYFPHYDQTDFGYHGRLFLEVTPLSFDILVSRGLSLTQFRVKTRDSVVMSSEAVELLHSEYGIVFDKRGKLIPNNELEVNDGLYFHVDLDRAIVGFEARSSPLEELDMTRNEVHDPKDFWVPILRPSDGQIVLEPGKFYLLTTKERIKIPPVCCGEILPYDISSGEFRPHYAGFFDNGFGGKRGTFGVLEVRARDLVFRVKDGQPICRMKFEETLEVPSQLYAGHYTGTGPSLSKHFRNRKQVWK